MLKIGTNTIYRMDVDEIDQFPALKQIGFDCVMLNFFVGDDIVKMYDSAIRAGLEVVNIHAPISTVNSAWETGTDGDDYIEIQKERVDFCHSAGIPTLVLHATFLKNPPPVSDIGIARHMRLCEYAEAKGVRLAFENVEPYPHLDAVIKNMGSYHGFCWDIGHNRAYAPDTDFMALYGDKLAAVHIHDNLGMTKCGTMDSADDKHWLPYDGTLDWSWYADKIKNSSYTGPLTLELSVANSDTYREMGFEKLAHTAWERIDKIRNLVG